ncbi:hypothetical protein FRC14_007810 [Serendipita sp. 396]|nr:hypothetical protein FRC14_007810 [Serendipita sp. 396]
MSWIPRVQICLGQYYGNSCQFTLWSDTHQFRPCFDHNHNLYDRYHQARFKGAFRDHQTLVPLTESISSWVALWDAGGFVNTEMNDTHAKQVMLDKLHRDLKRLLSMATRETAAITRRAGPDEPALTKEVGTRSVIGALAIHYDPAGNLRPDGPRHNNDFDDISEISIAPTEEEMMCKAAPFLPGNIPGAPHHLAPESMERLLDIQFRLLREELVAPLRMTLQSIINDLRAPTKKTLLHAILAKKGGRYTAENGHADSAMASVYTSANPISIATDKRGVVIRLLVNAPPGQARDSSAFKRAEYWKGISRKRLMQGGLVGLVWAAQGEIQLFFGLISSSGDDIQSSCRRSAENLEIRVRFFDENMSSKVMDWCQLRPKDRRGTTILMVEAPVMYESIRPFLETLKKEPTSFPFSRYLVHNLEDSRHLYQTVPPPQYTSTLRAFTWNLKCLMTGDLEPLLNPQDTDSIQKARQQLRCSSRLDPSQADAMVDCLTKEFCLIQGPPGTGKSFTGIEIMRVLLANNVNKILLIAFTNHALDHLLQSVLKMGITSKIARLGSHSNDEDLKQFSLEELEKSHSTSRRSQSINDAYGNLKVIERELSAVLKQLQGGPVSVKDRTEYMVLHFPDHNNHLIDPPSIVSSIRASEEGWIQAGSRKPLKGLSHFEFWKTGRDIVWLEQAHSSIKKKVKHRPSNSFAELEIEGGWDDDEIADLESEFGDLEEEKENGLQAFLKNAGVDTLPSIPSSSRTLGVLQDDPLVWAMSRIERTCLAKSWEEGARQHFFSRSRSSFASLKTKYEHAKQQYEECRYQAKLRILSNVDIIGCTTTGAAKLTTLLSGTRPSVLLVEEAGQVLEAHILGSLVPSIEHVIMIGDPLQLRPTINNYSLSMDHYLGKQIYKFDQSTMERLDSAGMCMSQLSVQRRMRPEIASIARLTLYPHLEDNIRVTEYPAVRGLARNIFFFNHAHAEGGGDDESMSKFNTFEITMVKALVQHLLRQGPYTKAGSIVVLCMYLGQLAKLRDELQKSRIRVVLDSRDEDELRNREGDAILSDEDVPIKASDVKLSEQVLLRTVDNFQGEEADVVILSLVRNHGSEKAGTIGFLKSPNRVNVALTRARHGLFVFGNGDLLSSKSDMWTKVTNYFKETDCYGTGLPIACHLHPDPVQWVDSAEKLRQISPEGGCLRPCGYGLECRHTCPSKRIKLSAAANPAGVLAERDTHAADHVGRIVASAHSRLHLSSYSAGILVSTLPAARALVDSVKSSQLAMVFVTITSNTYASASFSANICAVSPATSAIRTLVELWIALDHVDKTVITTSVG